jgi:hypothetical protein
MDLSAPLPEYDLETHKALFEEAAVLQILL